MSRTELRYKGISYPTSTIGIARYFAPSLVSKDKTKRVVFDDHFFLAWPPNMFAFTSLFLEITGAHALVVSQEWLKNRAEYLQRALNKKNLTGKNYGKIPDWTKTVIKISNDWRNNIYYDKPTNAKKWDTEDRQFVINLIPEENYIREQIHSNKTIQSNIAANFIEGDIETRKYYLGNEKQFKLQLKRLAKTTPSEVNILWGVLKKAIHPERDANCNDIWNLNDSAYKDIASGRKSRKMKEHANHLEVFNALWTLHAIADLTALGWGIRPFRKPDNGNKSQNRYNIPNDDGDDQRLDIFLRTLLSETGNLSFISNDRGRVLPKRHTPQVGISLRAGSSNLAFHRSSLRLKWATEGKDLLSTGIQVDDTEKDKAPKKPDESWEKGRERVSILLLPWPLEIHARDFSAIPPSQHSARLFYEYSPFQAAGNNVPDSASLILENLNQILKNSAIESEGIDMVILPESAINSRFINGLEEGILLPHKVKTYIAGTYSSQDMSDSGTPSSRGEGRRKGNINLSSEEEVSYNSNELVFGYLNKKADKYERLIYKKHHQWKLDKGQIRAYDLGNRLHLSGGYWENIQVQKRYAVLANFGRLVTVCPIICEDLARQESLSDLIRAVGPTLVITILMDGPQLKDRWSAKYASVFADDPGSCVLTLTSAGMVDRWLPQHKDKPRAVALWCESQGRPEELILDEKSMALLLSFSVITEIESTIDGRKEGSHTLSLKLGACKQITGGKR
jgi:hypothetical protein